MTTAFKRFLAFALILFPTALFSAGTPGADAAPAVTILYNKGDDGSLPEKDFWERVDKHVRELDETLGLPAKKRKVRSKTGLNEELFWEWSGENGAARLQAGFFKTKQKFSSEYIRLIRAESAEGLELGGSKDTAKRRDVKAEHLVFEKDKKRVYIKDIPMIDQGEKGYCLPATVARVFALYGMESVDQHALAAVCGSSGEKGTSTQAMEDALAGISKKFHVKLEILGGTKTKWLESYNKIAKKKHVPALETPDFFSADAETLRAARADKAQLKKWMNEIRKTINRGVPVLWSVRLGIYPESVPIPQTRGGHMRLIVGYDDAEGKILFSDSWGAGHELKSVDQADACAMTFRCYSLSPSR